MKKKILIVVFVVTIISFSVFMVIRNNDRNKIDKILSSPSYNYLNPAAKEYVRKIYEETGEIILTEKNKKKNTAYLNPIYVSYLAYSDEEKEKVDDIPMAMVVDYASQESASILLPTSYDLRNVDGKNYVTPVRDQGRLGICWTFATAGAAESYLLKKNDTSYTPSSQLISDRQIDYATARDGISDYKSEYVSFVDRTLGNGGNFYISTIAMANGVSLTNYNSFKKYDDNDLTKMELSDVISYNNSLYEVNETINMPVLTLRDSTSILTEEEQKTRTSFLNEVKQNIMDNGAAYVATYMDSSCYYTDANLDNTVLDVYNCNIAGGHAMEIIGWNDDLEYSYCADNGSHKSDVSGCNRIVSGKGVWILKNSWGNEMQYPYLTYDSLRSAISFVKKVERTSSKNWDNNYVLGNGTEDIKEKTYYLSGTKIKDDEKIKKIKFITETPDSLYNIKVYKKDGTYDKFTQRADLPGLMTFDITKDITVNKDTKIIISGDNGFIDKVSIFTENINSSPYVDIKKYNGMSISDKKIRLYSETKNIPSGSLLTYKFYDSKNQDVSSKVSITNNTIAENNVNTLASFNGLDSGTYRVDVIYNTKIVATFNINIIKMSGKGIESDPYVITNSTQLYQIRDDLDAYYILGNDIDLTEDTHEGGKLSLNSDTCPQGFGWEAIDGFSGTLDGKGHKIKGLYQNNYISCNNERETRYAWVDNGNGLFSTAKGNVTIKNLILEDFDMNCQGGNCGALISSYIANDRGDETPYRATFENIALRNSKITGTKLPSGGGLFGYIESIYGKISINNIYIDMDMNINTNGFQKRGYLFSSLQGDGGTSIQNIWLSGNLIGTSSDDHGILNYQLIGYSSINVKNVLSTVTSTNVNASLLGNVWTDNLAISNVKILNQNLCGNSDNACQNQTNVNVYDRETQLKEMTKASNYSSWDNFSDNWVLKTIDGIPRIPVLKFVDFEYTKIPDIVLNQELNKKVSIYDYLSPKIDAAKIITYKSNNEDIIKIDDNGVFDPQSTGWTTIHVESSYDGYIKDVPINVSYVPHYHIILDGNGGEGEMDSIEAPAQKDYTLPKNTYTMEHYVFKEWNTKKDGTGVSYKDLGKVKAMKDKETITLYAQWIGEEIIVNFDANGGTVTPERKVVNYGGVYGDLPIPTKENSAFEFWSSGVLVVDAYTKISGYNLVAEWHDNAYNILYDANGGTLKDEYKNGYSSLQFMSDKMALSYANYNNSTNINTNIYERDGYTFKEWNTSPDGKGDAYTENQSIQLSSAENSQLKLYAIWESDAMAEITSEFASSSSQNAILNCRDKKKIISYYFGTNANPSATDFKATNGETSFTKTELVTLSGTYYLKCKNEEGNIYGASQTYYNFHVYTMLYSGEEGTDIRSLNYDNYDLYSLAKYNLAPSGTSFKAEELYSAPGNTTNYPILGITPGDPGTLFSSLYPTASLNAEDTNYTVWVAREAYPINYDANGGELGNITSSTKYYGVPLNLPKIKPTKKGYTFLGWDTSNVATSPTYLEGDTYINNTSARLYAVWKESLGKITYNANDGTGKITTQDYEYNVNTKLNKNTFVRDGYVFKEWNTRPDGKGTSYSDEQSVTVIEDLMLYAIWEEKDTFTIKNYTYDANKGYISKIMVNTTVSDYMKNIILTGNYRASVQSKTLNGKEVLYTGAKTTIYKGQDLYMELTNIVIGDINGDGLINSTDLLRIRQHLLQKRILSGEYYIAANINYDDYINSTDLLRVRQHLIGKKLIS